MGNFARSVHSVGTKASAQFRHHHPEAPPSRSATSLGGVGDPAYHAARYAERRSCPTKRTEAGCGAIGARWERAQTEKLLTDGCQQRVLVSSE